MLFREQAQLILDYGTQINHWEREFLQSVVKQLRAGRRLTWRQSDKLNQIFNEKGNVSSHRQKADDVDDDEVFREETRAASRAFQTERHRQGKIIWNHPALPLQRVDNAVVKVRVSAS